MTKIFSGDFKKLESEKRKQILPAEEIINKSGIRKGDFVVDFGSGIGYFTIPISKLVGEEGKVLAIDISNEMVTELKQRIKGITNIELLVSDSIPDTLQVDKIFISHVLHEVDSPKKFLKSCLDNLKKGGKIIIIDWQKKQTDMGPPIEHRLSKEEVLQLLNLKYIENEIHDNFYYLIFEK